MSFAVAPNVTAGISLCPNNGEDGLDRPRQVSYVPEPWLAYVSTV